jgi:hypothetical protein
MMKTTKRYILLLIILIFTHYGWAQKATAWAKLDTTAITIGDQIGLELGIRIPKQFKVQWPNIKDTLNAHIEVVKKSPIDTAFETKEMIMKQKLVITSFDSGYFEIPEFHFSFYSPSDSTRYQAATGSMFLQV